jgi:hypothetical protein
MQVQFDRADLRQLKEDYQEFLDQRYTGKPDESEKG